MNNHIIGDFKKREYLYKRFKPRSFVDKEVIESIYSGWEYNLPKPKSDKDIVVDIGCHIGVFTNYCYDNGYRVFYSYEANRDNYECFLKNTHNLKDADIVSENKAVFRSDKKIKTITINKVTYYWSCQKN